MNDRTTATPPNTGGSGRTPALPDALAVEALAKLGREASAPEIIQIPTDGLGEGLPSTVPVLWDRANQKIILLGTAIWEHRQRPARRTGTATVMSLPAFYELVNRHKDEDSAIFADTDWRKPSLTAVVDYHRRADADTAHEPRHLGHRIHYAFPLSDPWQAWVEKNGELMEQEDFARFMEDHIGELAAPKPDEAERFEALFQAKIADPHEVMVLSRGLAVTVEAKSVRAVSLSSGEGQLVFEEVHQDQAGQKLTVPGLFMLALPVFFRGEAQRVPVRLRYRVRQGTIRWAYEVWRPDEFVTAAIDKALNAVAVETQLPIYEGSPEG